VAIVIALIGALTAIVTSIVTARVTYLVAMRRSKEVATTQSMAVAQQETRAEIKRIDLSELLADDVLIKIQRVGGFVVEKELCSKFLAQIGATGSEKDFLAIVKAIRRKGVFVTQVNLLKTLLDRETLKKEGFKEMVDEIQRQGNFITPTNILPTLLDPARLNTENFLQLKRTILDTSEVSQLPEMGPEAAVKLVSEFGEFMAARTRLTLEEKKHGT
jgi:hypothetical protein